MSSGNRIYLDNAATTWPKPAAVWDAMDRYNRSAGVAVGRGAYRMSVETQASVDRCRSLAAELLGAAAPDRIAFTFNCTDGLNLLIHGLVQDGDHVVTSVLEHNSVLRPLTEIGRRRGIEVTFVDPDDRGILDPISVLAAVRSNTRLVVLTHASNVTGALQPIAEIGEALAAVDVFFVVDAAQTAGQFPVNHSDWAVDALCCAGHKGLLGPLGTGLVCLRPGLEEHLASQRQGGTATQSELAEQPESMPSKLESGNHNAPGLIGLEAGLRYLRERGIDDVARHERELTSRLLEGLSELETVSIHGSQNTDQRLGIVSITHDLLEPEILSALLDDEFGIQTRSGLHCAPATHRWLGTIETGGTLRISVGPFTTSDEIDTCVHAIASLTAPSRPGGHDATTRY